MTIFGTPGGTPLNTSGFQGTAPGNAAIGPLTQPTTPGVGLFPPNSNNLSGDSVQAAMSRGSLVANAYITNEGVGANICVATGGAIDGGNQSSPANGTGFGSAGGSGGDVRASAGGANQNNGPGAVGDVTMANSAPSANVTFQGGGSVPTQFAG